MFLVAICGSVRWNSVLLKHLLQHLIAKGSIGVLLSHVRLGETIAHYCRLVHVAQS